MYSRIFSSLAFSSKLPMYSTNFFPVGLALSIRDQSLSSAQWAPLRVVLAVLVLSKLGRMRQWRSICAERRVIRCLLA